VNPGVYLDLPADQYHAVDAVSATRLKKLHSTTPGHFKAWLDNPTQETTDEMDFGSVVDAYLLEKGLLTSRFVSFPDGVDRRHKEGKRLAEKWEAEGKQIVKNRIFHMACDAAEKLDNQLPVGKKQMSLFTIETSTGLLCKARPDLVPDGPSLWDLKGTHDATERGFERTAYNMAYHIQAALYLDLWNALCGTVEPKTEFRFAVFEFEPPHAYRVFKCSDSFIERGRQDYQAALLKYAECRNANSWPLYPQEEATLFLPVWANK